MGRYATAGRTRISEKVCEALGWRQPNGWAKDRACRDVLRALDAARFIALPPSDGAGKRRLYSAWKPLPRARRNREPLLTELPGRLSLRAAKGSPDEKVWNALVQRHHYLGHRVSVGRCMKFLICAGSTVVGAISLAESAWNVADRDRVLRHFGWRREAVANNSRFLILPHVRVPNVASRSLALLASEGVRAWEHYYACELRCLETFVDRLRFKGTSYKAANWTLVGMTKGYRKCGSSFTNSQKPKYVFVYPLDAEDRRRLRYFPYGRLDDT